MAESLGVSPLREELSDWHDWDVVAFLLARCLGLMGPDVAFATDAKHVFWTDNTIGNMLHNMLNELVAAGVLDGRDEPDYQYRWNSSFRGSWEH